jgi:hypothetical protein
MKLAPERNPFHVPASKIMYLAHTVGLLFLTDWLVPSPVFSIHCHLYASNFLPGTPPDEELLNSYFENSSSENWYD